MDVRIILNGLVYSLAVCGVAFHSAFADEEPSILNILLEDDPSFIITSENDSYLSTDNNFTNGIRVAYQNTHKDGGGAAEILVNAKGDYILSSGIHIAHNIYTGSDIQLLPSQIPSDDRPYAGLAYIGVSKKRIYSNDAMERWELNIGCIGPCARSEDVQTEWHEIVDAPEPLGWDNEVQNALALQFNYDKHFASITNQTLSEYKKDDLWFDFSPSLHGEIGTVFDSIGVGGTVRLGIMDSYFTGMGLQDNMKKRVQFSSGFISELFLFSKAKVRYMLYNATIEGGVFSNSSSFTQDSRRGVFDFEAGVALHSKHLSLIVSLTSRSTEVKAQQFELRGHRWLGVTLGIHL